MGKGLNLFDVYEKEHTDFSDLESLESFYNQYIDYWKNRAKKSVKIEHKCKCEEIANSLGTIKNYKIEFFKRDFSQKNDYSIDPSQTNGYSIDPVKAQARADFEEWKEKVIFEATTGKEYKKERGRVIEMFPHI